MSLTKQLISGFLLLTGILLWETYTDGDRVVQDWIYGAGKWPISRETHQELSFIFYKGIKNAVIVFGIVCLLAFVGSYKFVWLEKYRKPALLMFLSIVLVPVIVAGSKQITNVYCPDQLLMYGGKYPWVRVLENYPDGFEQIKRGKCFPAGHATVGFSLMMLYFCFRSRRAKITALASAITAGWISGGYQMLRGEHFLSHTLFTMVASWMVIILINALVSRKYKDV